MVTERSSWSHSAKSMSRHSQGSLSVLTKVWWKHLEANGGKSQQERQSKHTHCWRVAGWSRNRWSTVLDLPLDDPFQLQRTLLKWSLWCVFFLQIAHNYIGHPKLQTAWPVRPPPLISSTCCFSLCSQQSSPVRCAYCLRLSSQFFDVANFGMEA